MGAGLGSCGRGAIALQSANRLHTSVCACACTYHPPVLSRILPLSNGAKVQMINIRNIRHNVQSLVGDKEQYLHSSAILCGVAKKGRETKQISTRKQYRYSYPTTVIVSSKNMTVNFVL